MRSSAVRYREARLRVPRICEEREREKERERKRERETTFAGGSEVTPYRSHEGRFVKDVASRRVVSKVFVLK